MNIEQAAEVIQNGGIVAFPTETVYGLGADAWNPTAISKVFEAKGRPSDNPLIVHVNSEDDIHDFAINIPDKAHQLIEEFWPGPLTLVLKKRPEVLDAVTAGLDTVASVTGSFTEVKLLDPMTVTTSSRSLSTYASRRGRNCIPPRPCISSPRFIAMLP